MAVIAPGMEQFRVQEAQSRASRQAGTSWDRTKQPYGKSFSMAGMSPGAWSHCKGCKGHQRQQSHGKGLTTESWSITRPMAGMAEGMERRAAASGPWDSRAHSAKGEPTALGMEQFRVQEARSRASRQAGASWGKTKQPHGRCFSTAGMPSGTWSRHCKGCKGHQRAAKPWAWGMGLEMDGKQPHGRG